MGVRCAKQAVLAIALCASVARGNVVGPDSQNFNPTTNGVDYVTVQSSTTLAPGIINVGAYSNYAVNSLPVGESETQTRFKVHDTLLMGDLNFGIGLLRGWEVGFSYPHLLKQTVKSEGDGGEFHSIGNTELRPNTKFRLFDGGDRGLAAVITANFNRIIDNPYVGSDGGPSVTTELVGDRNFGSLKTALNLGYRSRNPGTPIPGASIQPTRDQIIASVGASYYLPALDTKVISEIYGSRPVNASTGAAYRQASSVEWIGGLKYDLTSSLAAHFGVGTELIHGAASPDWRIYAGLNFTDGPVFETKASIVLVDTTERMTEESSSATEFSGEDTLGPIVMGQTTLRSYAINFKFDSTDVTEDSKPALDILAAYLMKPPVFKELTIEGHTDSVGPEAYNQKLSNRRAEAVRQELIARNIDPKKLKTIGYGESRPIADNGNFQGRKKNRRVDFVVER